MKKKNLSMARSYLAFYILIIFMGAIPPLLTFKFSLGFTIALIVIECLCLAGVICSHVFYNKEKYLPFYLCAGISFIIYDLITLYGFVLEIIYTSNGEPAPYAWTVSSLSIIIMGLVSFFVALGMYRIKHPVEKI